MNFPKLKRSDLLYSKNDQLLIPGLSLEKSLFKAIEKKDYFIIYSIP